jgi:hypothetical protein
MCKWGDTTRMCVRVPRRLSATGRARMRTKEIDRCIAPLVKALNRAGIATVACCCGHGHRQGRIDLDDGRTLKIVPPLGRARR